VTPPDPIDNRTRQGAIYLLMTVLLLAIVIGLQIRSGAGQAEFGGHPDEAAHYVTGLMVRDYLASGLPGNPMAFAEQYYDHYPKVALGNWPPGFYGIQALWTLTFSETRMSVMILMAVLTSLTGLVVFRALLQAVDWRAAVFGALLLVSFGLIQQYGSMVMTEIPVALFSTMAMVAFGRWLDHQRTRDSLLFGVLASMAIMTKGSGFAVGLVPPLAILFSGRVNLLKRTNLYYALGTVIVLAGPWTWMFREVTRAGWEQPHPTLDYTIRGLPYFFEGVLRSGSVIIALFGLIGTLWAIGGARGGNVPGVWISSVALVTGVVLFHSVVPASFGYRHLTQALPSWAMLATAGAVAASHWVQLRTPRLAPFVALLAIAGLLHTASSLPDAPGKGFARIVEELVERPENDGARFLIASDATGEGMFIAEVAMRERRPGHVVRRASKVLSAQAWHGGDYKTKVGDVPQVVTLLQNERIRFVVFDESNPAALEAPHMGLLRDAIESSAGGMSRIGSYPIERGYPREVRGRTFPAGVTVFCFCRTAQ
jgi:hypothetical protein